MERASAEGGNCRDGEVRSTWGEYDAPLMFLKQLNQKDVIQARMPANIVIK